MPTGPIGKTAQHYTHMFNGVDCTEQEFKDCSFNFEADPEVTQLEVKEYLITRRALLAKPILEPKTLSIEATLAQRGSRYGDFTDHARICQNLKAVMEETTGPSLDKNGTPLTANQRRGWRHLDPVKKQALEVIMDKVARILSGDPNYDDNWIDIQGYAKLVQDRLPKKES